MSLVETLVGVLLFGLLATMLVEFLLPAMRNSGIGSARAELQRQVQAAQDLLGQDLRQTLTATLSPGPPVVLGLLRGQGLTASGGQVWENGVVLYSWDATSGSLRRAMWTPALAASPLQALLAQTDHAPAILPAGDLATLAQNPALPQTFLCGGVTALDVLVGEPPQSATADVPLQSPVTVHIQEQRPAAGSVPAQQYDETRTVTLRVHLVEQAPAAY